MAIISVVTGKPGSGKSATQILYVFRFLRDNPSSKCFTNLPITDEFHAYCEARKVYDTRERLRIIDHAQFRTWTELEQYKRGGQSANPGPWSDISPEDHEGSLILVDECHLCMPNTNNTATRKRWCDYLSEVRHYGAEIRLVTQHLGRMDKQAILCVEQKIELVNICDYTNPWLGINYGDLQRLKWSITKTPMLQIVEHLYFQHNKGWKEQKRYSYSVDPDIFSLYKSRSAAYSADNGAALEYKVPTVRYALKRLFWGNLASVSWRIFAFCGMVWLTLFGGLPMLLMGFFSLLTNKSTQPDAKNHATPAHVVEAGVIEMPQNIPPPELPAWEQKGGVYVFNRASLAAFLTSEIGPSLGLQFLWSGDDLTMTGSLATLEDIFAVLRFNGYRVGRIGKRITIEKRADTQRTVSLAGGLYKAEF